jgi:hypothetical protein
MKPALNHRAAALSALTLAAGVALFVFARGPLRGFGGDVLIILFGVSSLAAVGIGQPRGRILAWLAAGVLAEAIQLGRWVGPDAHPLLHATLGSTADPWDLLAYLLGGLLCWPAERWWARRGAGEA